MSPFHLFSAFLGHLKFLSYCLPCWTQYVSARLTTSVERSKITFSSALSCAWWEMVFGVVFPSGHKCRVVGLGVTDCLVCRCVQFVACQTHAMLSKASSSYLFSYARKRKMKIRIWPGCEDEGSLCSFISPMDLLKM